jgi:hypothetical protein
LQFISTAHVPHVPNPLQLISLDFPLWGLAPRLSIAVLRISPFCAATVLVLDAVSKEIFTVESSSSCSSSPRKELVRAEFENNIDQPSFCWPSTRSAIEMFSLGLEYLREIIANDATEQSIVEVKSKENFFIILLVLCGDH